MRHLTLAEKAVVLGIAGFGASTKYPSVAEKELLDAIHKDKILLSDWIFVIDINGYVGQSTKSEIEFAKKHNITVIYMSEYVISIKPENRPDELNGSKIVKDGELLGWFLPQERIQFANSKEMYTEVEMSWGQYKREQGLNFKEQHAS